MRKKRFRTALFGYNKREVEAHVLTMEMEMQKRSNVEDRLETVSYTHLDVYKRQVYLGHHWVPQRRYADPL